MHKRFFTHSANAGKKEINKLNLIHSLNLAFQKHKYTPQNMLGILLGNELQHSIHDQIRIKTNADLVWVYIKHYVCDNSTFGIISRVVANLYVILYIFFF